MSFTADLSRFVDKATGKVDRVVRGIVIELGTRIIMRNPVGDTKYWKTKYPPKGYVGGRSRANWQYNFGQMPTNVLEIVDTSGSATIKSLTAGVLGAPAAGIHWIANNVDYIKPLEEGWSRQAPNGMVHVTVLEFQQVVREAANNVQ